MELSQLMENGSNVRDRPVKIRPFEMETLIEAFRFSESGPIDLPSAEKGTPTIAGKSKSESKDKDKKHKKHKDKDREKSKEHKKHKHRHKDRSKDKDSEKKKDRSGHHDSNAEHSKKHHDKKRKHEGSEDFTEIQKHKKSKHRSSKIDEALYLSSLVLRERCIFCILVAKLILDPLLFLFISAEYDINLSTKLTVVNGFR
ncbi:mediator of RNA polymerase II transcription subunit 19a-like isoform X5 [Papaver somniferum]|nr:mediator of RNA polymerase II transcription subunit 19a-like isoform X5 [Papaver somniferum]XP_026403441.1 mediator of RNA polymerase II transcription subunit 19a-like isoform X5 [Papaver somniferum]